MLLTTKQINEERKKERKKSLDYNTPPIYGDGVKSSDERLRVEIQDRKSTLFYMQPRYKAACYNL